MHLVTTAARQASSKSADTAAQMHTFKTRLDGEVGMVVGTSWAMIQADSFLVSHTKWSDAMTALHAALLKLHQNSNDHALHYERNDDEYASGMTRIEAPSLGAIMRA
jgi:hypothetical protein